MDVLARGSATVKEAFRAADAGEALTEKKMNIVMKITEGGKRGGASGGSTVKETFCAAYASAALTEKQMKAVVKKSDDLDKYWKELLDHNYKKFSSYGGRDVRGNAFVVKKDTVCLG